MRKKKFDPNVAAEVSVQVAVPPVNATSLERYVASIVVSDAVE